MNSSVDIVPKQSVRRSMHALQKELDSSASGHTNSLPHIKSIPDPSLLVDSEALQRIVAKVQEQCASHAEDTAVSSSRLEGPPVITDHWLLTVPAALRRSERDVVNYLGMVVAIDFRHWAEENGDSVLCSAGQPDTDASPGVSSVYGDRPRVLGFYTTVRSEEEDGGDASPSAVTLQQLHDEKALHVEVPLDHNGQMDSATDVTAAHKPAPKLLRGSAAMIYLLRQAVEKHGVHWYDPAFLSRFVGPTAVEDAQEALSVCFLGAREDGCTPLWMPATRERVSLLLSLANIFASQRTSFYDMLWQCDGRLFGPEGGTDGFIQALVRLHPRYHDIAPHPLRPQTDTIPILKLSQLTALALENALPALWRFHADSETLPSVAGKLGRNVVDVDINGAPRPAWLRAATAAAVSQRTESPHVFTDAAELSICCDYQIPKALRDAGLLVYDEHLSRCVDTGVALMPTGTEEVAIRVATLLAAEKLLVFLSRELPNRIAVRAESVTVPVMDYALWYVGRYPNSSAPPSRHHLCRTVMY